MDFNEEIERKKWELTEEEFNKNVEEIFSELALLASPNQNPSFIFVGGQARFRKKQFSF